MQPDPALAWAILDAACEATRNGILVQDPHGAILKLNGRFAAIFDLPGPAADRRLPEVLASVAAQLAEPGTLAALQRDIAARPDAHAQVALRLTNGTVVALSTAPLPCADGPPLGRIWMVLDGSGPSDATARPEQEFRGMVEQEAAGVCIVDESALLAYVNPAFAAFFGCTPAALVGQPILQCLPEAQRDHVRSRLAALLAGGQDPVHLICPATGAANRPADVLIRASATRYRGRPAVIAVVLDVTDQEQARRELEFANIIIEQSPVVLFQLPTEPGTARGYVSHNITQFGYSAEQGRNGGFPFPDFVMPADHPAVMAGVRAMRAGTSDLFEQDYRAVIADGSVRWIHDRTVPIRDAAGNTVAFRGTLIDITERKQAEQSLARANRTLRTLSSGNEVLVRASSERQLLDDMCRVLAEVGGYPLCCIGFADSDGQAGLHAVAFRHACSGPPTDAIDLPAIMRPDSAAAEALARGAVVIRRDSDGTHCPGGDAWRRPDCACTASAAFPFRLGPGSPGVLLLSTDMQDAFDTDELRLLSELASDLGYGIRALRAHAAQDAGARRLREIMHTTVQALVSTLEQRDEYTAGHQRRVAALSGEIARMIGLPAEEVEGISLAALVHDVGKVRVPSEILAKPSKLSALEYQLVQTHAEAGYEILKGIAFPWPVAGMVLQHHERMDGSGYPHRLKGSEILIGARVIAVADVVESMMTHRPYRPALGQAAALEEIALHRGQRYDAAIVDACIALFERRGFQLPKLYRA